MSKQFTDKSIDNSKQIILSFLLHNFENIHYNDQTHDTKTFSETIEVECRWNDNQTYSNECQKLMICYKIMPLDEIHYNCEFEIEKNIFNYKSVNFDCTSCVMDWNCIVCLLFLFLQKTRF